MKKYIYVLLLLFPLIILGIVNISSTVLARLIPVAVKSIEFSESEIIGSVGSSQHLDVIFTPSKAQNKNVTYYSTDEEIATVDNSGNVNFNQYGYCEIIAVSEDGKYEATCDINIKNPSDNPEDVKAIVLQYKENIHGDYKFGSINSIDLSYKIYPKETAVDDVVFTISSGAVVKGENKKVNITFANTGEIVLTAKSLKDSSVSTSYSFNVNEGYNVTSKVDINTFNTYLNTNKDIYLLEDYSLDRLISYKNKMIYGNGKKLDHSYLPHYDDTSYGNSINAITLLENAKLINCRVVGKVKEDMTLYDRVSNISMSGTSRIEDCIIENGKYNISTHGKSIAYNDGTDYYVINTKCIGAAVSSIQVNNSEEDGYKMLSTELFIQDFYFDYTYVGIIVENSESKNQDEVKGYSKVTILKSKEVGKASITSNHNNWLNVDSVAGTAEALGFGYLIDEFRDRSEFVKKDKYGDYYVNCAIIVNGGRRNISEVIIDDESFSQFEYVERVPKSIEAMQLGGNEKYRAYLFKSSLCQF